MQTAIVNNTTYHVYTEDEMSELSFDDFDNDLVLFDLDDWDDLDSVDDETGLAIINQLNLEDEWFAYVPVGSEVLVKE